MMSIIQIQKKGFALLIMIYGICLGVNQSSFAQIRTIHTYKVKNTSQLHDFFKYTSDGIPLISGHRGGMIKGYPENSIETFENTLSHTPAFFEIDPRLTKDSVIVLMHDETLDRTTTGKGKLAAYTYEELQKFTLRDPEGNVTEYKIPTLAEAIEWARGKTILNLDKKDVPMEMIADIIRKHKAASFVMLTVHTPEQARFYLNKNRNHMFSAFVKTPEEFEAYVKAGIPWSQVMAYVGPNNNPEVKKMYELLHAEGVKCMISAAPTYDKLEDHEARKKAYQDIIKDGADVIESDLPIEAAEAIQNLIPQKS